MNFTAFFIRRPVTTTLLSVAVLVFGGLAYQGLSVSDLPAVDYPTITVSASLPGASPETMASSVATPLEKQFTTIAGLDNMTSTSALGATSITLQFALSRNIDDAAQDVQSAISKTQRDLPPGIIPPSMSKSNPADQPILYLSFRSKTLPLSALDELVQQGADDEATLTLGLLTLYGSISKGRSIEGADHDRARLLRLAQAYRTRGGASLSLVETWVAAVKQGQLPVPK